MSKLTLEHIAPYLPYGLKVHTGFDIRTMVDEITSVNQVNNSLLIQFVTSKQCKPILRKMDLAKTITIDEKEVTPILELANICSGSYDWTLFCGKAVRGRDVISKEIFNYENGDFYFYDKIEQYHVNNQLALFKWLYANKFDVEGLIDSGLAVDVETLETNPYE